jgi:hypothetical protein
MQAAAQRSLRGALAGATAAAVWAAQEPLDRRIFGVPYSDVELLGRWVVRRADGPWRAVGLALHVVNGAAFGAIYANLAPAVPAPPVARGLLAGLTEHLASWPGTRWLARVHPSGDQLPLLWGSRRAFAQAAWRHALFGVVLGETERRLNQPEAAPARPSGVVAATNGHGSAQALAESLPLAR